MPEDRDLAFLLSQAGKCRRLAREITDEFANAQLLALADELEDEAKSKGADPQGTRSLPAKTRRHEWSPKTPGARMPKAASLPAHNRPPPPGAALAAQALPVLPMPSTKGRGL
jgi:hypothetical protein